MCACIVSCAYRERIVNDRQNWWLWSLIINATNTHANFQKRESVTIFWRSSFIIAAMFLFTISDVDFICHSGMQRTVLNHHETFYKPVCICIFLFGSWWMCEEKHFERDMLSKKNTSLNQVSATEDSAFKWLILSFSSSHCKTLNLSYTSPYDDIMQWLCTIWTKFHMKFSVNYVIMIAYRYGL